MLKTQKALILASALGVALVASSACVTNQGHRQTTAATRAEVSDAVIHVRGVT